MPFSLLTLLLAQTFFTWTDKKGIEHYTDDRSSIPKGATVTQTQGDELNTIEDTSKPLAPAALKPAAPQEETAKERRKREETWRTAFRAARNRVADLEVEVETERKQVEEINGLPVTGRISCRSSVANYGIPGRRIATGCSPQDSSPERLARNRAQLQRAKDELSDLERRAADDAVPLEWRH